MAPRYRAIRPLAVGIQAGFLIAGALTLAACFGPDMNAVANRLREDNIKQKQQITTLQDQLKNRDATILDLQEHFAANNPPIRTLPAERLAQLFTASRLEIQSQTDAADLGGGKQGFRVFLRTYDDDGQLVTASGEMTIEAFVLPPAPAEPRRIGTWTFTPADMKKAWFTGLGTNHYAFSCPWEKPPEANVDPIVFKARFRDALTGQTLMAQLDKKITPISHN
jgi:hypothetical protein